MVMFNETLKRDIYRDLAAKQHLATRMARVPRAFACDAMSTETAEDYCRRMLEKLGMKVGDDPIMNLTMFLHGHDAMAMSNMNSRDSGALMGATRRRASMDAGESFVDRYINSGADR